jgi:hypothetical protein
MIVGIAVEETAVEQRTLREGDAGRVKSHRVSNGCR